MKSITRTEYFVLFGILVYSFIPTVGGMIRVFELAGGPSIAPMNPRALADPLPIVFHILSSFLFCVLGAFQFLPSVRRNHRNTHRIVGCVAAVAGCVSAASGVWMTNFYTFSTDLQGNLLYWVRMMLGPMMIGLILLAVFTKRTRNIFGHGALMLRAYAIGQGASTQTFLGIGWIVIAGTEAMGPARDAIMIFAWVLNLMIAESLIGRFLVQSKARRTSAKRAGVPTE